MESPNNWLQLFFLFLIKIQRLARLSQVRWSRGGGRGAEEWKNKVKKAYLQAGVMNFG